MAKERVQVQGLGDVAPGITPTIQRAGQYSVAQLRAAPVQAPRSKLLDLAEALGTSMEIVGQYGKLKEFEFKKGQERGEMEAATADLEQSIEDLDATGEKLVEQGLLPRSQLVGYQRAFRRRIGQRVGRKTYASNLEARMEEVTQNLDSDADIIENILAEERQKITEQLGGSQFAMQGFGDYADSIENSFYNNAVKQRDRATQKYNESLVIEEANQDFGDRVLTATDPKEVAQLQLDIKNQMDSITEEGRIPRSRVVELYWNGFAVPNINNLLAADNPQPDKAEKMLDALLDIDLTGKGGKLGNINREGAYIRSKAVEIRNKIEASRRAIDSEEGVRAKDIVNLFMPAASSVMGGFTGRPEIDKYAIESVADFLKDAGWDEEYANNRAEELIRNQDIESLKFEGLKYRDNDVTKGAWNAATGSINDFTIRLLQKTNAVMPFSERESALEEVEAELAKDPKANVKEILAAKQVTDPRVIAQSIELSRDARANIWFEGTESFKNFDRQFEDNLDSIIDAELFQDEKEAAVRNDLKAGSRALFQEQYMNELRVLQSALKDDPERDVKIAKAIPGIQNEVAERWRDFKNVEKQFREGKVKEIAEEMKGGIEPFEAPEIPDLEEAVEDIDTTLNGWLGSIWNEITRSTMPDLSVDTLTNQQKEDLILDTLGKNPEFTAAGRELAFKQIDFIKTKLETEEFEGNTNLEDSIKIMRQFYGFRNPSEIPAGQAMDFDFRFTPMYDNKVSLTDEANKALGELIEYLGREEEGIKTPATVDIDDYPTFKLYNETFGINSEAQLKFFVEEQKRVLDLRNQ